MVVSEHFLHTKPSIGYRFVFMLRKGSDFSEESIEKSWGKNRLMKAVRSSSHVLIVHSFSSSSHVFASPDLSSVLDRYYLDCNHSVRLNANYRDSNLGRAKHRLEIHFHVEKKHGILQLVGRKSWGKESANESSSKFISCFDSSFIEFVQPRFCLSNSEEFMNAFMRIGFGSTIKLVSFDKGQVVTFNGKFVNSFKNNDHGTRSRSDNTVDNPHRFAIHGIKVLKGNEKATEVIDVENWRVDNSRLLRCIVSLFEWNFSVSSTKSSIQITFRFK
uniref:Uncharacterized protein n=1 Tax=Tanacetum cinerariifolium TaxID=118510 RepID=A0A699JL67_TANCI|nr:hypothetical protein [Tanacetum cinerariifolium]